jgi:hypothetical protein
MRVGCWSEFERQPMRPRGRRHSLRSLYVPKDVAILSISKLTVLASATTTYGLVQSRLLSVLDQGEILFPAPEEKGSREKYGHGLRSRKSLEKYGSDRSAEKPEQRGGRKKWWWDSGGTEVKWCRCTVTPLPYCLRTAAAEGA